MPSLTLIFTSAPLICPRSPFIRSLLTVWRRLRLSLLQLPPSCQEEIDRQPLVWNGQVRDASSLQLGERSHIAWVGWSRGPARTLRVWRDSYRHLETAALATAAGGVRGAQARCTEIDGAIPICKLLPPEFQSLMPRDARWLGQFTPLGFPRL